MAQIQKDREAFDGLTIAEHKRRGLVNPDLSQFLGVLGKSHHPIEFFFPTKDLSWLMDHESSPAFPQTPENIKLVGDAWRDPESMKILADMLLMLGIVTAPSEEEAERQARVYVLRDPKDWALFRIEASVREWIVSSYSDLELRVTGSWQGLRFIVTYNSSSSHARQRVSFNGAPLAGVPRGLSDPVGGVYLTGGDGKTLNEVASEYECDLLFPDRVPGW